MSLKYEPSSEPLHISVTSVSHDQMGTEMPCRMFTLLAADGPSCEILSPHSGEEVALSVHPYQFNPCQNCLITNSEPENPKP